MTGLMVEGILVIDQDVLGRHVIAFFSFLFGRRSCEPLATSYDVFSLKLTVEEIARVTKTTRWWRCEMQYSP